MHVKEVESESRKLRLFTDSRFKLKSEQYEKTIKAMEEEAIKKMAKVDEHSEASEYKI